MQKSLHKLQSKQKIPNLKKQIIKTNQQTIQTNHQTIQSQSCLININSSEAQLFPVYKQNNLSRCDEQRKNPQQAVHLEIQLDDGKVQIITPNINDDPIQLARKFCESHQLDQEMVQILSENIKQTINKLIKTKKNIKNTRTFTQPFQQNNNHQQKKEHQTNSKHFQSISKQFSKKQDSHQQHNSKLTRQLKQSSLFSRSPKMNHISKQICNKKQDYKSIKKLKQYHSVKTEKSLKTQPFEAKMIADYQQYSRENLQQQSIFDYENIKRKEINIKNNPKNILKKNDYLCSRINQKQSKIKTSKSFMRRVQRTKSRSKDSLQKSVLRSSVNSQMSQKRQSSNLNRHKPLVNYSLVNLTTSSTRNTTNFRQKPANVITSNILRLKPQSPNLRSQPLHDIHTDKLYQNQKHKAFRSIFTLLDDNQDGVISIVNINLIDKVEQKLIQVLFPVLEEMEILQTQLNREEFCQALNKLFTSLCIEEKGYLLKYCHRYEQQMIHQQNSNTHLRQPRMSPISRSLVNQTSRHNVSVYEYSKIREQLKHKKLQQQRVEKQRTVMRSCTFHPKVNPKKIIYF